MKCPLKRKEVKWFWIFVSPAVAGFVILTLGPMIVSFYLSLTKYNMIDPPQYIGFKNYTYLALYEPTFWVSLKVTLLFTVMCVPLGSFIVPLFLALLLNMKIRAIGVFRTIYFLPSILPAVASGIIWVWIFNPRYGLLNNLLERVGIEGPAWIYSTAWALPALVIMATWAFGGAMLIFLAGLQGIPRSLYEAAEIDGAGLWQRFRNITLPALSPVIFFNLIMGIIAAMKVFDQAFVFGMAGPGLAGGPGRSTLFFVLNLYQKAFSYFHMGLASAMAWILFVLILILTLVNFWARRLWVYYETE